MVYDVVWCHVCYVQQVDVCAGILVPTDKRFSLADTMKKREEQVLGEIFYRPTGRLERKYVQGNGVSKKLVNTTITGLHIFRMDKWTSDDTEKGTDVVGRKESGFILPDYCMFKRERKRR